MYGCCEVEGFELCFLFKLDCFVNCVGEQFVCDGWFDYGVWLVSLYDVIEVGVLVQCVEVVCKMCLNWKCVQVLSLGVLMGFMLGFVYMCL